jgi:GT2 family glycosyltransferase
MKTLIGMVTFGNLPFTQLAINEIRRTTKSDYRLFVVIGKPDDNATREWLLEQDIDFTLHEQNLGFPASLNDIYDMAFNPGATTDIQGKQDKYGGDYDNVIYVGNDVIVYPGAIDAMIAEAARGEYDWICASEYNVQSLCRDYAAARPCFREPNFQFKDFAARPWDLHLHQVPGFDPGGATRLVEPAWVQHNCRKDVRNLALFTRRSFEVLGYADVNFWPGGYFEDNDYGRRGDLADVKACGLAHACYFHFWSRTIHQGAGTASAQFGRNSHFYQTKWGGPVGGEKFSLPFAGNPHYAPPGMPLSLGLKICDRGAELELVRHWMAK